MSDRMAANISITGKITSLVAFKDLARDIETDGGNINDSFEVSVDPGLSEIEQYLLHCSAKGLEARFHNSAVPNGVFDLIEATCCRLGVAYHRRSEGFCEIMPETVAYFPGEDKLYYSVAMADYGEPLVGLGDLERALDGEMDWQTLVDQVRMSNGEGLPEELVIAEDVLAELEAKAEVANGKLYAIMFTSDEEADNFAVVPFDMKTLDRWAAYSVPLTKGHAATEVLAVEYQGGEEVMFFNGSQTIPEALFEAIVGGDDLVFVTRQEMEGHLSGLCLAMEGKGELGKTPVQIRVEGHKLRIMRGHRMQVCAYEHSEGLTLLTTDFSTESFKEELENHELFAGFRSEEAA